MVSMRHGNAVNLLTCHMAGYLNTKRDQGRADSRQGLIITYHLPSIKYRATGARMRQVAFCPP